MDRTVMEPTSEHSETDGALLSCGHEAPSTRPPAGLVIDCHNCDRRELPDLVTRGRTTRTFTASTTPTGLRSDHQTNAWATIEVTAGSVNFREADPPWEAVAEPNKSIVIVPGRAHLISPSSDAVFTIQFFDLPSGVASPD